MLHFWGISTGSTYNSKYGSAGLKPKYMTGNTFSSNAKPTSDYVETKRRKQTNYGWIPNALLLVGTAIGVYKGKAVIQKVIPKIGKLGKSAGGFMHKICPNICDAVKSLGKAVTSPFRLVGKAGKFIGGIFKK